jgi:hypothetical protein
MHLIQPIPAFIPFFSSIPEIKPLFFYSISILLSLYLCCSLPPISSHVTDPLRFLLPLMIFLSLSLLLPSPQTKIDSTIKIKTTVASNSLIAAQEIH